MWVGGWCDTNILGAVLDFLEAKVSEKFYTFYLRDICVWKGVGC